jgi:hypothetical protein
MRNGPINPPKNKITYRSFPIISRGFTWIYHFVVDKNTIHLDNFYHDPLGCFWFFIPGEIEQKLPKSSVWDGIVAPILITWRCEVPKRLWPPWRFTKSWFLDGSVEITTVLNL